MFKGETSDYRTIAFETYAIDYADQAQTQLESIFRIGFDDGFPGTYQQSDPSQDDAHVNSLFYGDRIEKTFTSDFSWHK